MNEPSLPGTLSDALALAVKDARLLDRSLYQPHSRFWHGYNTEFRDKCLVCLAGSIIARSFDVDSRTITCPGHYPLQIDRKLRSINLCRRGDFLSAICMFYDRAVPVDIERRLLALAQPEHSEFIGWEQFESHLDSLEAILPALREIENEALSSNR